MDQIDIEEFIKEKFKRIYEQIEDITKLETSGNLTYKIKTQSTKYILRLCGTGKRYRTKEEVQAEVNLISFLKQNNIPTMDIMEFKGESVISLENKNGICYKYIEGKYLKSPTPNQCHLIGNTLAKIHKLTENYNFTHDRKKWGIEETKEKLNEVEELFKKDAHLEKNNFAKRLKSILNRLQLSNLPSGPIHEDLGIRHILFKDGEIKGILDWDRSYPGAYILDLGQTIRGWCFDEWKILNQDKLKNLLEGYENSRPLSKHEKESLEDAIKFAFIERAIAFAIFAYNTNKPEYKDYAIESINLIENLKSKIIPQKNLLQVHSQ